jgi:hypothetical protein
LPPWRNPPTLCGGCAIPRFLIFLTPVNRS